MKPESESRIFDRAQTCLLAMLFLVATTEAQEPNRFNDTPLHIAASTHNLALVQQLVDEGAVIDARNKNSLTPLWFAAQRSSNPKIAEFLLDRGAQIDARGPDGGTPLMAAAARSHIPEMVQLLLDRGARIDNRSDGGGTALMYSVAHSRTIEIVQMLLDHGAQIVDRNKGGMTPLMFAVQHSYMPEIVQLLLDKGADVQTSSNIDMTPLHFASARSSEPEIVQMLLDRGARVEVKNNKGMTPLMYTARYSSSAEIATLLIDKGADLEARIDDGSSRTPLMLAAAHSSSAEIVKRFIDGGAELEARSNAGATPLMIAARHSTSPEIVKVLLDEGAELEARGNNANNNDDKIPQMLARDPSSSADSTPLMQAAAYSSTPEIVKLLIDYGAELEARNKFDMTPLIVAAAHSTSAEIVKLLIDSGAELDASDPLGMTPLLFATGNSSPPRDREAAHRQRRWAGCRRSTRHDPADVHRSVLLQPRDRSGTPRQGRRSPRPQQGRQDGDRLRQEKQDAGGNKGLSTASRQVVGVSRDPIDSSLSSSRTPIEWIPALLPGNSTKGSLSEKHTPEDVNLDPGQPECRVPGVEDGLWAACSAVSGKGCGSTRTEISGQENHHQRNRDPDRCQRPASRMDPSWKRNPLRFQPFTRDGTKQEAR